MTHAHRNRIADKVLILCAVLGALLLFFLHHYALPSVSGVSITPLEGGLSGMPVAVTLPDIRPRLDQDVSVLAPSPVSVPSITPVLKGKVEYGLTIRYAPHQQTEFQLYSQGCVTEIRLNDIAVAFDEAQRCRLKSELIIDLAPYLHGGVNRLAVVADAPGFHIAPLLFHKHGTYGMPDALGAALLLVMLVAAAMLCIRLLGDVPSALMLVSAILLYIDRFVGTGFFNYAMDMPGHLEYIIYIVRHWQWPPPYAGIQFYHPPLYYTIAAVPLWLGNALGTFDGISLVRCVSLLCFIGFILIMLATLRRMLHSGWAYYPMALLVCFYPAGIFYAARIDSHVLFYPFYAACIYCALRTVQEHNARHAGWTLIWLGGAFAVRSNALLLLPILALLMLYVYQRQRLAWRQPIILAGIAIVMLGLSMNFGRTFYYASLYTSANSWIVGNIPLLHPDLAIPTRWNEFFTMDIATYLDAPFMNTWKDDTARRYFWNYMLKTSLTGEFVWRHAELAHVLSLLLLALILFLIIGTVQSRSIMGNFHWQFSALILVVPILMLMMNRIMYSYSCSQDVRYIYPALLGFCGMFGMLLEEQRRKNALLWYAIGVGLAVGFSVTSALFFLRQ